MKFENEKELELLIAEDIKKGINSKTRLPMDGTILRQVVLPGYGVIDILSIDITNWNIVRVDITICELKINPITCRDVAQISRYYRGFVEYMGRFYNVDEYELSEEGIETRKDVSVNLCGILVGPSYDNSDACFLVDSMSWLDCYHYEISLGGVEFESESGYYRTDRAKNKILPNYTETLESILVLKYRELLKKKRGDNNG